MAFQARAIDTLLADIRDPNAKRFDRLNALHALRFAEVKEKNDGR
jgi:hypothetical protein